MPFRGSVTVWPGPTVEKPWALRESAILVGATECRRPAPPLVLAEVAIQPSASATRSSPPGEPLNRLTAPFWPTGTTTRLGIVWPAPKLRLETKGRQAPEAQAVR